MKWICVCLVAALSFVSGIPPECLRRCPRIYRPVCGFDGEVYKMFDNKCLMEVDGCVDSKAWSLASMENCGSRAEGVGSCERNCPKIFKPVCGFDGRGGTYFDNECLMEERGCIDQIQYTLTDFNKCKLRVEEESVCDRECPQSFEPVCGFNGDGVRFFDSECMMEKQNCEERKPYTLTNIRECILRGRNPCFRACNLIYAPVCGFNGDTFKIFANQCVMEVQSCEDAKPWTLSRMEQCHVGA